MIRNLLIAGLLTVVFSSGCAGPRGKSIADKRNHVDDMRQTTLNSIQASDPELAARAKTAPGYAVFSNTGAAWIVGGGGHGYGVVVNNQTGEQTYMREVQGSLGLGVGLKEYKVLMIFNDARTLHTFVNNGWEFGGEAAATATTGERGGEVQTSGSMTSGMDTYQFTDRGIYVRAAIQAAKIYPDKKLNAG